MGIEAISSRRDSAYDGCASDSAVCGCIVGRNDTRYSCVDPPNGVLALRNIPDTVAPRGSFWCRETDLDLSQYFQDNVFRMLGSVRCRFTSLRQLLLRKLNKHASNVRNGFGYDTTTTSTTRNFHYRESVLLVLLKHILNLLCRDCLVLYTTHDQTS
jgi:hypothetical protein